MTQHPDYMKVTIAFSDGKETVRIVQGLNAAQAIAGQVKKNPKVVGIKIAPL